MDYIKFKIAFSSCISALLLLTLTSCARDNATMNSAVIIFTVGKVSIIDKSNSSRNAQIKDTLNTLDIIKTGEDSEATIQINNQGLIRVLPNSEIILQSILNESTGSMIQSKAGRCFYKILKSHKYPFKIVTQTCVIAVRGTQFLTECENNISSVSVYDGVVNVNTNDKNNKTDITQGKKAEIDEASNITFSNISKIQQLQLKKLALHEYIDDLNEKNKRELKKIFDSYKQKESEIDNEILEEVKKWNELSPVEKLRASGKPLTELTLKDGNKIIGSVVSQNKLILSLDTGDGTIKIQKQDIIRRKIIK